MAVNYKKALNHLIAGVQYVLLGGLFALSLVWPRDNSLWVFGARDGHDFVGNPKYLYLYTAEERSNIRAVWMSRNRELVESLREQGYEAHYTGSFRGVLLNLQAGFVFLSHGAAGMSKWCYGGATVVGLWHGVALKKFGWDYGYRTDHSVLRLLRYWKYVLFKRFDLVTVTSEAMIAPFSSAFRIDPEQLLVTGYPRNDLLTDCLPDYGFSTSSDGYELYQRLYEEPTVFFYAPTYHEETGQHIRDHLRLDELNKWLTAVNGHLIIKPHPREQFDIDDAEYSRITLMPEQLDSYPVLLYTDILITDYSSIYFDYLHLDRPVVFYPFDLEQYRSRRGFYLDYETVTPGLTATGFDELLRCLEQTLELDTFFDERKTVREQFLRQPVESRCKDICDRFDPEAETSG